MNTNEFRLTYTRRGREIIDRLKTFVDKSGYPVEHCTYFRKVGPPAGWCNKREPERGSEVFVSGLPFDAIEDDIFEFFSRVGKIFDMRLVLDDLGLYNRGCAFVRFTNSDQAKNAVEYLDKKLFACVHKVNVQKSLENNRLYMCGLPFKKTKIQIWNELIACGICGVTDVIVYQSRIDFHKNRGFVFVEFESNQIASGVHHKYNKNKTLFLFGRQILVDWSISTTEFDKDVIAKVTRLFLRNLPMTITRKHLLFILSKILDANSIEKVYKMNDYAFVHFCDRNTAEYSLKKLNQYFKGTNVEITWSIPPNEVRKVKEMNAEQHKVLKYLSSGTVGKEVRGSFEDSPIDSPSYDALLSQNSIGSCSPTLNSPSSSNLEDPFYTFPFWWDLLDIVLPKSNQSLLVPEGATPMDLFQQF